MTQKIPRLFGTGTEAERKLNEIQIEILKNEKELKLGAVEHEDLVREQRDAESTLATVEDELKLLYS